MRKNNAGYALLNMSEGKQFCLGTAFVEKIIRCRSSPSIICPHPKCIARISFGVIIKESVEAIHMTEKHSCLLQFRCESGHEFILMFNTTEEGVGIIGAVDRKIELALREQSIEESEK